jgi:AcrR family transcriptional regulator
MAKTEPSNQTARLPRRERERLQRHNSIIDAAEKRFFESGFDGVSMDDIAHDLELSKPALYRYFKNKESLFYAVVLRGMVILRDTIKQAVNKEKTGRNKVLGFIQSFCFDYVRKNADYYRLLNVAREQRFLDMFQRHEIERAHEFGQMALEMLTYLVDAIKLGIKDGTIRQSLDPLQTAIFLVVTAEATINLTPVYEDLVTQKNIKKDEYLQHSFDLMLHGISLEKPKK